MARAGTPAARAERYRLEPTRPAMRSGVRSTPIGAARNARRPFTLDYLPQAVALLWQLGRDDDRPLNQFPDHPIRVLQDLTGYEVAKPLVMNRLAFAAMAEIARRVRSPTGE